MTHAANVWFEYLWNLTVQATVILTLAFVVTAMARRQSASFRHLVWTVCLLSLPFQPLVARFSRVRLPVTASIVPASPPLSVAAAPPPALIPTSPTLPDALDTERTVPKPAPLAIPIAAAPVVSTPKRFTADAPAAWMLDLGTMLRAASPRWPLLVVGPWLAGALLSLCRLAAGLVGAHGLRRASAPVTDGPIAEIVALLPQARFANVRQAMTDAACVPMSWGALHSVILLPMDADMWPEERLRAALLHEAAHVSRQDWLTQTLMHFVCALLWFHPSVWLAARACRAESERACDDFVLSAGMSAVDYARHLLDVARGASRRRWTGAVAMAQMTRIETRLRAVLDARQDRRPLTRTLAFAAAAVSALLLGIGNTARLVVPALADPTATVTSNLDAAATSDTSIPESAASWAATLPNGVRVRLTGVNDYAHAVRVSPWRSADGSSKTHPYVEHIGPTAIPVFLPAKGGEQGHMFAVQWDYDETKLPKMTSVGNPNFLGSFDRIAKNQKIYYLNPTYRYRIDPHSVNDYPKIIPAPEPWMQNGGNPINGRDAFWLTTGWRRTGTQVTETSDAGSIFRMKEKTCTVKFGVAFQIARKTPCAKAVGRTIVDDPAGPVTFMLALHPHLPPKTPVWQHRYAQLKVTDYFPYEDERSVFVLDADGRIIYYSLGEAVSYRGNSGKLRTEFIGYLPPPIVARAKRFELVNRPYQWASFPNVRLEPRMAPATAGQEQAGATPGNTSPSASGSEGAPVAPDTITSPNTPKATGLPENFHLSLAIIGQSPSSPGTKTCTFCSTFSYDPYKLPSVPWAGKPNPVADFRQTFYGKPLDAAKGLYFCTPAFIGSFDQVIAKPPLLQLDFALMKNPEGPLIMGVHVRPYATGVHTITLMQTFPASMSSAPFKFGIADGPFQMVTCPKTIGKTVVSNPAGQTTFTLNPAPDAHGQVALETSDLFPQDNQRIVLALDSAGRAVYDIKEDLGNSGSKLPTILVCRFPASILSRVAQFELLCRPYVWMTRMLTVGPNPAKMPNTAQLADIHASFLNGPVAKVVAERASYDAKNKIMIFQNATVTLSRRGQILGIARCRHANHNSDGNWTLQDATVSRVQEPAFHTSAYFLKADGQTMIVYP